MGWLRDRLRRWLVPELSGKPVRILNVVDPALVGSFMDSMQGERTVLDTIAREPGRIRRLLDSTDPVQPRRASRRGRSEPGPDPRGSDDAPEGVPQ